MTDALKFTLASFRTAMNGLTIKRPLAAAAELKAEKIETSLAAGNTDAVVNVVSGGSPAVAIEVVLEGQEPGATRPGKLEERVKEAAQ